MKSAGLHKLYVVSSRVFTSGLVVAAIWTLVSQRDIFLNLNSLGLSLFVVVVFHLGVQVSAFASTLFFRRRGFAALFSTQLSLNYRSHMANFVTPSAIGSALKLKRFASRHSPGHALWYLIQERLFSFFWFAILGLIATLVSGGVAIGQNLYQVLIWSFGGCVVLSLVFGGLLPFVFKSIEGRLPRRVFNVTAGIPNFKEAVTTDGVQIIAYSTLILTGLGAGTALAVGFVLWPSDPTLFLLARVVAALISLVPLPIPGLATRELGSIGLLLLLGAPASMAALASSIYIFGIVTGAIVGVVYELLMLLRKREDKKFVEGV